MSCKNIIFSLDGSRIFYRVLMSSGRSHCNNLHLLPCFVAVILEQKSTGFWRYCATFSTIQFFDFVYYSQTKIKNLNKTFGGMFFLHPQLTHMDHLLRSTSQVKPFSTSQTDPISKTQKFVYLNNGQQAKSKP